MNSTYKGFYVIGIQRSGTTWLTDLISNNFDTQYIQSFWKHRTPLGVQDSLYCKKKVYENDLILDNNVFYIAVQKDYNTWLESIKRKKVDFRHTHITTQKDKFLEVYNSWDNWKNDQLQQENFYFKTYLDWLKDWETYLQEIEQLTGWKRKNATFKNVSNVSQSEDFDITRYIKD